MIDVENEIYTRLVNAIRKKFGKISISGEYVSAPSHFPHISIIESDNYVSNLDSSDKERYSTVVYEINIYSNKRVGKKSECKAIAQTIDEIMYTLNFKRRAMTPVPNLNDATIYRIVARYRAETDGKHFYRR